MSQLQKLADRAEWINEWMEMDAIKLARMIEVVGRRGDGGRGGGREFYAPPVLVLCSLDTVLKNGRRDANAFCFW